MVGIGFGARLAGVRAALHFLVYLFFRAVWMAGQALPLSWVRGLLEGLAQLAARADARHRRVIRSNVDIAFPDWSEARKERLVVSTFSTWGRIVAELMHARELAGAPGPRGLREVIQRVALLRGEGRGVLILTAHTGNFELMGRACGLAGVELAVFHRPMKNPYMNHYLLSERAEMGMKSVGRNGGLRAVIEFLRSGGVIAAPLDQNQRYGHGIFVETFGRAACTSTMLARLSLATGAPVLPVFAAWEGDDLVVLSGEAVVPTGRDSPACGFETERDKAIASLTAAYCAEVERQIRRFPDQWNWAHRRWKTRPSPDDGIVRQGRPGERTREPRDRNK
ncbi:MAG: lysophospholipid acyltransferase family protein [Candidatus Binatia bacterium]